MRWRRITIGIGLVGLVAVVALLSGDIVIDLQASDHVYASVDTVPERHVAIVPGARVYSDGTPSPALEHRLECARRLLEAGKVEMILVSGDHAAPEYDETNAMQSWLMDHGVAANQIALDHAGFRTLDTMQRAARVFGVKSAVICTHEFHQGRSVFLARQAGIDAVGLIADLVPDPAATRNAMRESVARAWALLDVYVLGTEPRHLGPTIDLKDPATSHDGSSRRG
ncbi:MAG: SanA protein [Myxococcota bacterium]|jgi:SanA protein